MVHIAGHETSVSVCCIMPCPSDMALHPGVKNRRNRVPVTYNEKKCSKSVGNRKNVYICIRIFIRVLLKSDLMPADLFPSNENDQKGGCPKPTWPVCEMNANHAGS